jgi:hypothetical protein
MCALGGGSNRCIVHNPVSKFVVKVVTVKTKADEPLVSKTLSELSKEGRKLPSPAPEVVKSWIETEKFAAQYDPELSEHDRKIQMNRLNSADTENVAGGHFHAWKNLNKAVRSKMSQRIAAAGLVLGMSVSLVGCFANGNTNNNNPETPTNAPTSIGQAIGSGEKVTSEAGSYEKITFDKNAPIYQYNNGNGNPEYMTEAGWTVEDGAAGQRLAVDYMTKEFIDSNALDGGDKAYQDWYNTSAKSYYADYIYKDGSLQNGSAMPILGNYNGNAMPNLIKDGAPREKTLDLKLTGFMPYDDAQGTKGIQYGIEYTAEYRVDDASAAAFAGKYTNMSGEEFLKSPMAKESLKDGSGENIFIAKGTANIVVNKDANNEWKIIGFSSNNDYDTTNFTQEAK